MSYGYQWLEEAVKGFLEFYKEYLKEEENESEDNRS